MMFYYSTEMEEQSAFDWSSNNEIQDWCNSIKREIVYTDFNGTKRYTPEDLAEKLNCNI